MHNISLSLSSNLFFFTENSLKKICFYLGRKFSQLASQHSQATAGVIGALALSAFGSIAYFYWKKSLLNAKPVADWTKILLAGTRQSDHEHLLAAFKTLKRCNFDYIFHYKADAWGPDVIFDSSGALAQSQYIRLIADSQKSGLLIVLRADDKGTKRWEEKGYLDNLKLEHPNFNKFVSNSNNEIMILNRQEYEQILLTNTLPKRLKKIL